MTECGDCGDTIYNPLSVYQYPIQYPIEEGEVVYVCFDCYRLWQQIHE